MHDIKTASDLDEISHHQLLNLFSRLTAPAVNDMQGEYAAHLLGQPNWPAKFFGNAVLDNPLRHWRCKAFRPVDELSGRGYNTFEQRGRIVQCYPMGTQIAPSRFDGHPAYQLVYRQFHSTCALLNMVDEVRQIVPGLYLGIGTLGFTKAQRRISYPFVLSGPEAKYRGDTGRVRKQFKLSARELPALFS